MVVVYNISIERIWSKSRTIRMKLTDAIRYVSEALKKPEGKALRFGYREIKFFFRFMRPVRKLFVLSIVLAVIMTGIGSILPLSSKVLIDFVILKEGFERLEDLLLIIGLGGHTGTVRAFLESIELVVAAVLFAGVLTALSGISYRYVLFRLQNELGFNLQSELFDRLLRFPLKFFKRSHVGYLSSRVSDDINALHMFFSHAVLEMIPRLFRVCFGIAIVFLLSTKLSLILLSLLPLYAVLNYYFSSRLRNASLRELESSSRVSKEVQEVLSGIDTVKSYDAEERESGRFSKGVRSLVQSRTRRMVVSLFSDYSSRALQFVITLLLMWFGVREISRGAMTLGDYVAFTSYVLFLSGSVSGISMFYVNLQPVLASLERLSELFGIKPEDRKPGGAEEHRASGVIDFRHVAFSYEEGSQILKDVSFSARPGEVVALVGPSGAGKTTIVNLLLRFYEPNAGSVSLDGVDLKEIPANWLRRQIGVVSQDIFLFSDTIANNIRYSKPSAGMDEVVAAARKAGIHDDIMRLTEGYETPAGERGVKLSAGQRQRISIARAFLKDSPVLVFDEPTSALDAETEELFKKTIKNLSPGRTILVISHRHTTVDIADKTLVVDDGKVAEGPALRGVSGRNGLYSKVSEN